MVLADDVNGARLGTLVAFIFGNGDANFTADLEFVECNIDDAVAVEINLAAVGGLDEAVTLLGEKLGHPAMGRRHVCLGGTLPTVDMILESTLYGIESVADGDIDVLMGVMFMGFAIDHDFGPGNREIDADVVKLSLVMVPMRRLDDDMASGDTIEELFEPFHPLADPGFHRIGGWDIAKRNLQRNLNHVLSGNRG